MWINKFKLLCWKNYILVKRHWIQAIFEILFPIAIVCIFSLIRNGLDPTVYPEKEYPSLNPFKNECFFGDPWNPSSKITKIGYSPSHDVYAMIMKPVAAKYKMSLDALDSTDDLNFWTRNQSSVSPVIAIQFDSIETPLKHLKYTIRLPQKPFDDKWMTNKIYYQSPSRQARINDLGIPTPYYPECFLGLQNEIDRSFIKYHSPETTLPDVKIQAFPYPKIVEDLFLNFTASLFPIVFVISILMSVKNMIKNITIEIETSLKESMKMMGMDSTVHWCSWFAKCFIMLIIPFTINCIIMTTTILSKVPIFAHSNPLLIWLFFVIYIMSVITFSFLMCVIFKKSSPAGSFGSLLFFLVILPYNKMQGNFHAFPYIFKALYCMIVNTNMGQALYFIMNSESLDQGVTFSNLFHRDEDLKFSFAEILIYMIAGSVIMLYLTMYIERVLPGEFGIAEPAYYPLLPLFNFLKKRMGYRTFENEAILQERKVSNPDMEVEPEDLKIGIKIANLSKRFGNNYAVKQFSLNMYQDQITVLLGHNGAGKTTTMSMLVGLFSPTAGTAYLNGKDIRTELTEARLSLGICPQQNVLFEELTVKEHLMFFCALKGMTDKTLIAEDVKKYIDILDLKDKRNAESRTLSGGMKRKLCIGIALCGNAQIVILDEPSSGIDVAARRHLWDLLIAEKKNRTILLSTHFMDEADVLGDRIAIMTEGKLRTVGSGYFLKKKFGTGYRLTVVKSDGFNCNAIKNLIESHGPGTVYIESDDHAEATFVISEDKLPHFEFIFKELEDNAEKLKVNNFGCSLTTLEEVFLKLGVENYQDDEVDGRHSEDQVPINMQQIENNHVTGTSLIFYQIEAVLLKKFHVLKRMWKTIMSMVGSTALMFLLAMTAPNIEFNSDTPLKISFDSYQDTTTVLQSNNLQLLKAYEGLFTGKDKIETIDSTGDMSTYILKKGNESFSALSKRYMIGVTIDDDSIMAWFNGQPYHTSPLTINTINRALLRNFLSDQYDITVTNNPYNMITNSDDASGLLETPVNVVVILLILFLLLTTWPIIFITPYIKERELRAKLLMLISGLNRFVYWLVSFAFDLFVFFILSAVIVGTIAAFQKPHFSTAKELLVVMAIIMNYGFSYLPLIYACSYIFNKHSSGEKYASLFSIIFAVLYGVVKFFGSYDDDYNYITKPAYWISLLFAPFNFIDQLTKLGTSFIASDPNFTIFTFESHGILWNVVMSFISAVIFLTICLLKDHLVFEWFFYNYLNKKKLPPLQSQNLDEDVKDEIDKVKSMSMQQIRESNLVVKEFTKYYGNFCAVNQLHLDIEQRECFGLLGVNGSGKTSTFKMMTGDEIISFGDGWVRGFSMKNELNKVHQLIGYCPQFDAILPELTGNETLRIFSLIRGIPRREIKEGINRLANEFGFTQHLNKRTKAFSGGNKRKLSTALAILGDPQLIFLDEPTTGIDPQAKHHMWGVIKKIRDSGRAVVITSHSMDECEALCTKIGIMVKGEFKCLGSAQYLKNKYSKGFVLTIKMGRDDQELSFEIQNRVKNSFNSAELKEKYLDILTFHIPNMDLKWSQVFAICSQLKRELNIYDYALTQMSLEQVFMIFSKAGMYQDV